MPQRTAIPSTPYSNALRLYETVLIREGRIPLLALHWARLCSGLAAAGIFIPARFTEQALGAALLQTASAQCAGASLVRARARVGMGNHGKLQADVSCSPLSEQELRGPARGLCVGFSRVLWSKQADAVTPFKVEGTPVYEAARLEAAAMGWDDALLCSEAGVVEGAISNVWWAEGDWLFTTPLSTGAVAGVARAALLRLLPQLGYNVAEEEADRVRILAADAAFLSNALRGLRTVRMLADVEYAKSGINVVHINAALYN